MMSCRSWPKPASQRQQRESCNLTIAECLLKSATASLEPCLIPYSLWARGGTSNFAKTDPQNYHSKRRAEARQTVPAEEARRKVELLLLEEGKRVRRAGGVPFTAQGGLGSRPTSRAESVVGSPGGDVEEQVAGLRESDIGEKLIPALEEHVDEQEQQAKEEQVSNSHEGSVGIVKGR